MITLILAAAALAPSTQGGPLLSLADARRVMAAAQADAAKRKVSATLAIIDQYGELVLVEAAADAQGAAVDGALSQARASLDGGSDHGAARAAGVPLVVGGKVVGAIGDVGGSPGAVAKAGAEMLK